MVTESNSNEQAIARVWSGRVPDRHTQGFHRHLLETGLAEAKALPGYRGAFMTQVSENGLTTFTLTTFWESTEAMRGFSQSDEAVLYPGDDAFELRPDLKTNVCNVVFFDLGLPT